ncbi:glycosyltransferase family 1 protein [Pontibacter diazotrophicus]|uniref:Glycosyltransferase family 1 protein n=1 Tax=Pontibacter diazotrophicus TaxID=1400979 RepID=A0A3D8LGV6_9BACT|nr:glycosyltransferase [Pontibacter diazotrophicus]RDV16689.1 glycosyltransferase family 1 protein [Pontibacter diazotrophicus]
MNFVFVSLQRINTDRDSTSTSLAKELAKNHRVLYINSPIDRRTYYSKNIDNFTKSHIKCIKTGEGKLKQLNKNLWVLNPSRMIESINWIPSTSVFSFFNRKNNLQFSKDIKEAVEALGFDNYILINDKDIFRSFYLKEILKPDKYIYLDRDYTIGMDYWKKHGVELEPRLMQKSDAVVCNSHDFVKRAKLYNPNSFYIGNGFNLEQYNNKEDFPVPDDLKGIPGPIVGYVGALITLRLDLDMMIGMAEARPDLSFVLIGWEDEAFEKSSLHTLSNVYFLGKKHTKDVPAYIKHFDVCINPQVLNEITSGNFPLKIVEYLAMGKPVVATTTPTMQEIFGRHTYLADSTNNFLEQIDRALREEQLSSGIQYRRDFAANFSWKNVASALIKSIESIKCAQPTRQAHIATKL